MVAKPSREARRHYFTVHLDSHKTLHLDHTFSTLVAEMMVPGVRLLATAEVTHRPLTKCQCERRVNAAIQLTF